MISLKHSEHDEQDDSDVSETFDCSEAVDFVLAPKRSDAELGGVTTGAERRTGGSGVG